MIVLETIQLVFNIVTLFLLFAVIGLVYKLGQEVDFDPNQILTSLRNSNAGVASGTARQKKVVDEMFGEALLTQYPLVAQLCNWRPDLGAFLQKNPGMVPYAAQLANSVIGVGVDKLPPQAADLIKQFMGAQSNPVPTKKVDEKMPWEE